MIRCGCENTLLRLDGKLYLMESHAHGLDSVFPGLYNSSTMGDNSFFRVRDFKTGYIIANVSQSIGHSFCAATADHTRRQVWVFCGANARGNKLDPGPCGRTPRKGCYVGAWNASFNDLATWSATRKALVLPDGMSLFNNDVALVHSLATATATATPAAGTGRVLAGGPAGGATAAAEKQPRNNADTDASTSTSTDTSTDTSTSTSTHHHDTTSTTSTTSNHATAKTKTKTKTSDAAPAHQAVMIIEGRSDNGVARPGPFAVNTGKAANIVGKSFCTAGGDMCGPGQIAYPTPPQTVQTPPHTFPHSD